MDWLLCAAIASSVLWLREASKLFARWITRLREPNAGNLGYVPKRKDAS